MLATAASPTSTSVAPTPTSRLSGMSPARFDCQSAPDAHVTVATVIASPASASESPRTRVSISVRKASIARNDTDRRKADAPIAPRPGAALNVPGGAIRRSAGMPIASPTATATGTHHAHAVIEANTNAAPTMSCSGHRSESPPVVGAGRGTRSSTGAIRAQVASSTGIGATNAQRHPTVLAIVAPTGGPTRPGRIHIVASRASTRGRRRSG